jgi:WD40 repeat protein
LVNSAELSPDGQRVITASEDKTAKLWDASSGVLIATLSGHGDAVFRAEFSPDGRSIVTASADKTAKVWNARDGRFIASLNGHEGLVFRAAFSPDGRYIVTASADETAKVWHASDGRLMATLKGHDRLVSNAVFSPDGRHIATLSGGPAALLWDATPLFQPDWRQREGVPYSVEIVCARGTGALDGDARVITDMDGIVAPILREHVGEDVCATPLSFESVRRELLEYLGFNGRKMSWGK